MDLDIKKEIEKYKLTDKEFEDNSNNIFNELSLEVSKTKEKQFIIVGGQAGSGKTTLVNKEYQELKRNAIIINQDELRTKFPQKLNDDIISNFDDRTAYLILRPYIGNLLSEIIERSIENNYNVIFETALSRVEPIMEYIDKFMKDGYNIKLSILAVHEIEAKLSMIFRYSYLLQKDGVCRRASRMKENSYNIIFENIDALLDSDLLNKIEVYMRNSNINELPIKIYSADKKDFSKKEIMQAIRKGEINSYKQMERSFQQRYNFINEILKKHGEYDKIIELEDILKEYQILKSKENEER